MVSGTISLLLSRCFSPFLHSTRTLSVSLEYLALPDGPGGFAQNSSCSALLRIPLGFSMLRVRDSHPLWSFFPERSSHKHLATAWSYNPMVALPQSWFGLFPVRSPLLGESLTYFLFLQVLRCFSSLRTLRVVAVPGLQPGGFPHSDISGSIPVCKSPELFAAYHVLLHFRKPRHPPFALLLFLVLVNLIRLFTVSYYSFCL